MDEEQQIILRMLKEGKISVEEADALLQALAEQRAEEEAGEGETPEIPEAPPIPKGPPVDLSGLREELREIIAEIMKSIPKDVIKGVRIGVRGARRHGFFHLVQGLRGLEEGQAEFTVSEPMASGETLEIRNAWGDVHLERSADATMTLRAQVRVWGATAADAQRIASDLQVTARRHGSTVVVAVPRPEGWRVRVDLQAAVPAGVHVVLAAAKGDVRAQGLTGSLRVSVASGDVDVTGQGGPADVEVRSGDLTLRQIDGDLRVDVHSGDVSAAQIGGAVRGRVISGDVEIDGAGEVALDVINGDLTVTAPAGPVSVETKSGDIDLRRIRLSGLVRVRAVSGDVSAEFEELIQGEAQIETVSGDIEVAAPADGRATIEASVRSGEVECTLPLQQRSGNRRSLRGVLNGPGARLVLHAFSGDIDVRER